MKEAAPPARRRDAWPWDFLGLALVALLLTPAAMVAARQATPAPPAEGRERPARTVCPALPVSPGALASILREPVPEDPDAVEPRGEPVPPGERGTIGDLAAAWQQCLASGDVPRLLGLFTADGINRLLGERSPYLGGPAGITVSILAVRDVQRLRDGRIGAGLLVDPTGRGEAAPEPIALIIEQDEDGGWRIDHLRSPPGPVGAAGRLDADPEAPPRALLRRPIVPGPGVPVPAPGPMVPMRGADVARTGIQTGLPPDREPEEIWRSPAGWHSAAQPVASRGLVYFGGFSLGERSPLLVAVDAATGGVRWQTTAPVAWGEFPDSPALGGDILYAPVQAPVAGVMAVVAATGEPLWFAPFGFTTVSAPAVDADTVYVAGWGVRNSRDRATNDAVGAVFALDPRTGRERWRFLTNARFGPLAAGADAVYVPSDRGLYALDRATGGKRWQARFSPGTEDTPVVAGGAIVFAGEEITTGRSGVFALDAASGALRWRVDRPVAAGSRSGAAVANDTVFVSSWEPVDEGEAWGTPTVRAYDMATGDERWVFRAGGDPAIEPAGAGSISVPATAGEMVLFGVTVRTAAPGGGKGGDGLYAIESKTGRMVWRASNATPIRSAPAVLGTRIFVMGGRQARGGAAEGVLLAFGAD